MTKSFHSKIAGVTYTNIDGSSRQDIIRRYCRVGQELIMMPDISNPVDKNALGLWIQGPHHLLKLGYISSELLNQMREDIRAKSKIRITISNITGGTKEKPTLGVNIQVDINPK